MATAIEYALMAGASYISTRSDINKFPVPKDWTEKVEYRKKSKDSGFEATCFTNGNEIVISYAGTGPEASDWIHGNIPLAMGLISDQLREAADYYLSIKASVPESTTVTLTGHSLGGGLASLVAVLFGEAAFTFDQAPLRKAVLMTVTTDLLGNPVTSSAAQSLRSYLAGHTTPEQLAKLDAYIRANSPLNTGAVSRIDTLVVRESQVINYNVEGEVLTKWLPFSRIGTQADIPNNTKEVSSVDLHSQALLASYLLSNQTAADGKIFSNLTYKLSDLLKMIFDKNMYAFATDKPEENFLERLVRHEVGNAPLADGGTVEPDAMLTRFTADLWKIAQDGGLTLNDGNGLERTYSNWNNISKALTAFAMQFYYEDTDNSKNINKQLFDTVSGGVYLDLFNVSEKFQEQFDTDGKVNLNDAKGYKEYFAKYLSGESQTLLTAEERTQIESQLPYLRDWYVQAGDGGMMVTDSQNRGAFMLGGNRADTLTGGSGDDLLVGNVGADSLNGSLGNDILLGGRGQDNLKGGEGVDLLLGGADDDTLDGGDGNDLLLGGAGMDTYAFSGDFGTDIVADSDGLGALQVDGQALSGAGQQKLQDVYQDEKSDYTYLKVDGGKRLVILKKDGDGRILVKDWPAQGTLGINLSGDVTAAPGVTLGGDFKKKINDNGTPEIVDDFYVMSGGNYTPDGDESGALDLINGTENADVIDGKGGDDALSGKEGDDWILGGKGSDAIQGGMGRDTIYGGDGDDAIWGSSDLAFDMPDKVDRPKVINDSTHPRGTGFNWISGYDGVLANDVPDSYSDVPRNRLPDDLGNYIDGGIGHDFIAAGTGADFVRGGSGKDFIWGMDGDDVLFGNDDNDFIYGDGNRPGNGSVVWTLPENHGNDVIDGGTGDDYLIGQGGDDIIFGGIGKDLIWGDDEANREPSYHGNDFLFGGKDDDQIVAGGGNDYLEGGSGNDTLLGGAGDDVYYFNVGDGIDTLIDNKGEKNILRFGAGVDSSKIKLSLGSLLLDLGNGDAIHIDGFSQNDVFNSSSINRFEFADGGALTLAELLERGFDLTGTAGNDLLLGTNTVDRIEGLEGGDILDGGAGDDRLGGGNGDDELYGGEGNDYLSGGIGTDRLEGGSGDDTYYFEAGDGSASLLGLVEGIADEGGSDTVWFGGSISSNDVKFSKSAVEGYLSVDYNGGQDSLAIKNGIEGAVEFFRFGDKTFSWEELASTRGIAIDGTAGNDDLSGSRFQDRITGGTGDDILAGGAGNDSYYFNRGDGRDVIIDADGSNQIIFGAGIDPASMTVGQSMGLDGVRYLDLEFDNGDAISIKDGEMGGIASLQFADGSVLSFADVLQRLSHLNLSGTYQDDLLVGTSGNDVLSGGDGNDSLIGGEGADRLDGGRDNDKLFGGSGDDYLNGGDGNDLLDGGTGSDTYLLTSGVGDDVVLEGVGESSVIVLDTCIPLSTLTHSRVGDDLIIRFRDSSGSLRLTDYYQGEQHWEVKTPDGEKLSMNSFLSALDIAPTSKSAALADYKDSVVSAWQQRWLWPFRTGKSISADGTISNTQFDKDSYSSTTYEYRVEFDSIDGSSGVFGEEYRYGHSVTYTAISQKYMSMDGKVRISVDSAGSSSPIFIPASDIGGSSHGGAGRSNPIHVYDDSGTILGVWVYPPGRQLPGNVLSKEVTRVDTVKQNVLHTPEVTGSNGDDAITINGRGVADGGAGDDVLLAGPSSYDDGYGLDDFGKPPGAYLYGNDGNDTLLGGGRDDVLIGGRGRDLLSGDQGADTYRVLEEDSIDSIEDTGDDFLRYRESYYRNMGIHDYEFRGSFGNQWVVNDDGNRNGFDTYEEAIAFINEHRTLRNFDLAELKAYGCLSYVQKLPELPAIKGNDHAAIENLVASGMVRPDRVVFGPGVTAENLVVMGSEAQRYIRLMGPDGAGVGIALPGENDPVGYGIEQVEFVDGTRLSMHELLQRLNADRSLVGADNDEAIVAAAGNDMLYGKGGGDNLDGGGGDDVLDGGLGNDKLEGGLGADKFIYRLGDGSDQIADGGNDLLSFAQSQNLADAELRIRYGGRWVVENNGWHAFDSREDAEYFIQGHSIVPPGHYADGLMALEAAGRFRFVEAYMPLSAADDFSAVEALVAAAIIRPDQVVFGSGITQDNIAFGGNPALGLLIITMPDGAKLEVRVATAADPLGAGVEQLVFADGTVMNIGDAVALANRNSVLVGSDTSETLQGGGEDDIYVINPNGGVDHIRDAGGNDVLQFGAGIEPKDISLGLGSLLLRIGNGSDAVHIEGFDPSNPLGSLAIEHFKFADGTSLAAAELLARGFDLFGSESGERIEGTAVVDRIAGNGGDDVLRGGGGRDSYVVKPGDGEDLIEDSVETGIGNVVVFGEGIHREDVRVEVAGNDLLIRYDSGGNKVRVAGYAPVGADGGTVIDTFTFSDGTAVTLREFMNRAPEVANPVVDQVIQEDAAFSLQLPENLFVDADGDEILTRVAVAGYTQLPQWLKYDAVTRTLYGMPENADVGGFDVVIQGMDKLGASAFHSFHVTVRNTNDAPEAGAALPDLRAVEDGVFSFALPADSFHDKDAGDVLSYSATLENGDPLPEWLVFDAQTRIFSGAPSNGNVGDLRLRVTATDSAGESASQVFSLEVVNTNDAPTVDSPLVVQAATEDVVFSYVLPAGAFVDADLGDRLTYTATLTNGDGLPAWLKLDGATGIFSGTPGNGDVGEVQIRVTASDLSGASASQELRFSVGNTNDAPEVGMVLSGQQATEDAPFTFTVPEYVFRDVDVGDVLILSATRADGSALPPWLSFDAATRAFSGTPSNDDVGSLLLKLTGTDKAGAQVSQTFTVGVTNVNDAPETGAELINQMGRAGTPVNWKMPNGAFVDMDTGDTLIYTASLGDGGKLPDWLKFDATTGTFSGTPTTAGTHTLRVTATDASGAQASQAFTLNILSEGGNLAPITAPDAENLMEDRKLLAWGNVLANDRDPEGKALKVADPGIRQGEYGILTLLSNGSYAYVLNDFSSKVQGLGEGETVTERFSYQASDGSVRSSGELAVTVQGTNDSPELTRRLVDVQLGKGKSFSWQLPAGSFIDRDRNDKLTYTAKLADGKALPSWLKFDAATQTFSGTAPANAKNSIEVRVMASDGHGESSVASDVFKVSFGSRTIIPSSDDGGFFDWGGDLPSPWRPCQQSDGSEQAGTRPGERPDDDPLGRFLDKFFSDTKQISSGLPILDRNWFAQWESGRKPSDPPEQSRGNQDFERHWSELAHALNRLDAERQSAPAWSQASQGAPSGLAGLIQGGIQGGRGGTDAISLACGGTQLKAFTGLREGIGKLLG